MSGTRRLLATRMNNKGARRLEAEAGCDVPRPDVTVERHPARCGAADRLPDWRESDARLSVSRQAARAGPAVTFKLARKTRPAVGFPPTARDAKAATSVWMPCGSAISAMAGLSSTPRSSAPLLRSGKQRWRIRRGGTAAETLHTAAPGCGTAGPAHVRRARSSRTPTPVATLSRQPIQGCHRSPARRHR